MRVSILPILLAGAGVVSQATAEPIRVVVESTSNANANIRFGHALANANVNGNDDNVARSVRPTLVMTTSTEVKSSGLGRHFCGASLREKALRMSNAFRHALGLPLIETDPHNTAVIGKPANNGGDHHGPHIMPFPFGGTLGTGAPSPHPHHGQVENMENVKEILPDGSVVRIYHNQPVGHHSHHHHHMKHFKKGTFLKRIHKAIMALGPWEGRAVAFVLGCGIGVLLRMFWVLTVLTYRSVRGEREEETLDHEYILFEQDAENLYVAPPEYTEEKVRAAELEAQQETEGRK